MNVLSVMITLPVAAETGETAAPGIERSVLVYMIVALAQYLAVSITTLAA